MKKTIFTPINPVLLLFLLFWSAELIALPFRGPEVKSGFIEGIEDPGLSPADRGESETNLPVSAIGDRVWEDSNQDGIQNPGEAGIDSVVVNLYACADLFNPIATTQTANGGMYQFMGLPAGDYVVEFESVPGLLRSPQNASGNDQIDSDAGPDGFTGCITVGIDQIFNSVDAGYYTCLPTGSLTCVGNVTIAVDENCMGASNPGLFLESEDGCSDIFEVEFFLNGFSVGNNITGDYVGQELVAVITNPVTGNFCESSVTVVDNIAPAIDNCEDITVSCTQDIDPGLIGQPTATDNCDGTATLVFEDGAGQSGSCDDDFIETIIRTWTATDASGNSSTCSQVILVERPTLGSVDFPADLTETGGTALDCAEADTDPSNTGFPMIDGEEIISGGDCTFGYDYSDVIVPTGPSSFQVIRTWTILNSCNNQSVEGTQIIQVADNEAPALTCPADVSVGSGDNCEASAILPQVLYTDNCSPFEEITVVTETPKGTIMGNGGFLSQLTAGNNLITYVVTDANGNSSSCSINLVVMDEEAPLAICNEQISIGIGGDGTASVCWPTIDAGSSDNCGIEAFKVKRGDASATTPFTDCVSFDCADVGQSVEVRMRVYDIVGNFTETDPNGRWNECLVEVAVQDNIKPGIVCPPNKTLGCWEFDAGLWEGVVQDSTAGPPVYELPGNILIGYYENAFDNCIENGVYVNVSQNGSSDQCGEGVVTRIYTVVDAQGESTSCVQIITLENDKPFEVTDTECRAAPLGAGHSLSDGVEWPCDLELNTCGAGLSPEELELNPAVDPDDVRPQIFEDACDLVGISYEDSEFPIGYSACVKLLRKWTLVDWCQPDPDYALGYVTYTYLQEIKVIESQAPVISSSCEDVTVCGFEEDCGPIPVELFIEATDDCTDAANLIYDYRIDAFNDGNGSYDFSPDNNPFAQAGNAANEASGAYPAGTHKILWKVEDGCGNMASCSYLFTVEDCAPPTPICKVLSIPLGPDGEAVVFASSFENGDSYDNCTAYGDIIFSFSPDISDTERVLTCDDLTDSLQITLYATDEDGNQAFCETFLSVQDPLNACSGNTVTASVAGLIQTEDDAPVSDVEVTVSPSGGNASSIMQKTLLDGGYDFSLLAGENYTVEPVKNTNPLNGLTTFDLVLISQHILGVKYLDSPYKMIAADASNDGKVTTFDIVELRKLILHIINELPNNDSWRFVDKSYVFPNPNNPFSPSFPEVINMNDLDEDQLHTDFVGVKVGDVDNSGSGYDFAGGEDRGFDGQLVFQLENKLVRAGETFDVTFRSDELDQVKGFQFTIEFDEAALELLAIDGRTGGIGQENFGLSRIEEGVISCSWNGERTNDKSEVFTLTFVAGRDGRVSDWLDLNSSYLAAEAYRYHTAEKRFSRAEVLAKFTGGKEEVTAGGRFELYQNQPNPFSHTTMIGFYLPQAAEATLSIFDASGRMLKRFEGNYGKGYNAIEVDGAELGEHGLMYYQLQTPGFTDTKKMMVIQ